MNFAAASSESCCEVAAALDVAPSSVTPVAAYVAVDLAKLNGIRSSILSPSRRCGNWVKTSRN